MLLAFLTIALVLNAVNAVELHCPQYLYFHRKTVNINLTCTIDGDLSSSPMYRKMENIVWLVHTDKHSNEVIRPGEKLGRFMFHLDIFENFSSKAVLNIERITNPLDYGNYTLSVMSPYGVKAATIKMLEKGQGKAPFEWWDYMIFAAILLVSAGIGVYFGFFDKSESSQEEYMLGGRQMGPVPVSLSLLASFMSAITLLGTPSEVYTKGTQYVVVVVAYPFCMAAAAHVFLPIFYKLGVTSTYEYLEMRFSRIIRLIGASLFVIQMVIYMSMVVYMPSLALEAVIGLNLWFSALTTAVVCIFYTSMGGMKATMWTDAFQVAMMFVGLIAIFAQGCVREGGMSRAWSDAGQRGRIQFFEMNPDPRYRHSFWTTTVGGCFTWMYTYGVNQAQIQRGLSSRTLRVAQASFWMNVPCLMFMLLIPGLCGILIFSRYMDCDPLAAGVITKRDQLFIYYVMDIVAEDLPGIPGLFMATLFSAALSTLSSGINGLAAVTCRDYGVEDYLRARGFTESKITWVAKIVSVLYGALTILLILIIQYLPGILDSALALFGALGGPLLGVYVCGIFIPWINKKGAFVGLLCAIFMTFWMTIGEKTNPSIGVAQPHPSTSTLFCDSDIGSSPDTVKTFIHGRPTDFSLLNGLENLYSISYFYLSIVGIFVSASVGTIVSAFTGWTRGEEIASDLIHPIVIRLAKQYHLDIWESPEEEKPYEVPLDLINNLKKPNVKEQESTRL